MGLANRRIRRCSATPKSLSLRQRLLFTSLGDFEGRENMYYVATSNDDRKTACNNVMWRLDCRVPLTIFLNFRSDAHVQNGHALSWLIPGGWEQKPEFKSTVST